MIDFYYWPTPNGWKISVALEEMKLPYDVKYVNIGRGEQFEPEFLRISPNNRMPAIVDHEPLGGGDPVAVFESGAILVYLAEKTGRFMPGLDDPRGRKTVVECRRRRSNRRGSPNPQGRVFFTRCACGSSTSTSKTVRRWSMVIAPRSGQLCVARWSNSLVRSPVAFGARLMPTSFRYGDMGHRFQQARRKPRPKEEFLRRPYALDRR